jgi:catechol 2,3-dioxygenase-like lactoylglutathione lyase family enzyme/extradiol dioxygenase family protein
MYVHWEILMKKLLSILCLASGLAAGTAMAQPFAPNEAGITMGHWHLNSRDIAANKKIFLAMGGTDGGPGNIQRVIFPGVVVNLNPGAANPPPPNGGSVGSVVNHVGFIVKNVQESVAKWKAAGVPVEPGNNGRLDQAYVTTPDGLRIEILENKDQPMPIRNEHVHFFVQEAQIPQIQAWYAKIFGAKASTTRTNALVDDIPGVQLRFNKADMAQAPTKGRVLDHIGFDVTDLQGFIKKLDANGVKLDRPYNKNEQSGVALAFITDPWGTYIELNERPKPVYLP